MMDGQPTGTRIQTRNRTRIVDAAQEVFAERGFNGATVDRIAELAGMSKPNLHYYFKRKSDLYYTVLERILAIWLEPLEDLNPAADPRDELERYVKLKLLASRDHPSASRLFANEMLRGAPVLEPYLRTELRNLVDRKARVIRRWISEGRLIRVDPYHLIFLIWAATQHYADFSVQVNAVLDIPRLENGHYDDIAKSLTGIIFDGIIPS